MEHGAADVNGGALNASVRGLLDHCGFGRRFVRASGVWLFDAHGRRFLDGYAGYGALALGHNHPAVVGALSQALADQTPCLLQPYPAPHAEALADVLARLSGLSHCILGSTGAELVDAAIKAVRRATGRRLIVAARGSYHGKTLGALAATFQPKHRWGVGPLPPGFVHVPFGDLTALRDLIQRRGSDIAGILLEPIQGERGVIPAPSGYLPAVRDLCSRQGIALILDEIQTGLGRTGELLASQHDSVTPDVLLLAKALGGGLFPLSACLFREGFFHPDFALHHASTFANHNLASRVALTVLAQLLGCTEAALLQTSTSAATEGSGLIANAARLGQSLQERLQRLPQRFPRCVSAVRGRGLLAAIDLRPPRRDSGFLLNYLHGQGLLAYAFAALLAEQAGVLLLPSLGSQHTLRIAPPLLIDRPQLHQLCDGLESALATLDRCDSAAFARAMGSTRVPTPDDRMLGDRMLDDRMLDGSARVAKPLHLPPPPRRRPRQPSRRTYAFLIHPGSLDDLRSSDPGLAPLNRQELAAYSHALSALPAGTVLRAPRVRSRTGDEVDGFLIVVPMLPAQMLRAGRRRVAAEIQRAVDLAASLGAQIVGLGGFTTPYSRRGLDVCGRGPTITTGNSLTAVMAIEALSQLARQADRPLPQQRIAVVGARGSVGALCARLLVLQGAQQLVLVGNPHSNLQPLCDLADDLRSQAATRGRHRSTGARSSPIDSPDAALGDCIVEVTDTLDVLRSCPLIVSASGAGRPIIDDRHVAPDSILCDVARPFDVGPAVRRRSDVWVCDGGLVALPDPSLRFGRGNIVGLPTGVQLACLSETLILALGDERRDLGIGDHIPLSDAQHVAQLALQHGFRLAPLADPQRTAAKPAHPQHEQAA